mmetsp:Transcript_15483/g.51212  ORF Transcript_15483/g.51212 Transcript_15483/m.51212 type:complete len:275 (-) Transcript_15483:91-915(-)
MEHIQKERLPKGLAGSGIGGKVQAHFLSPPGDVASERGVCCGACGVESRIQLRHQLRLRRMARWVRGVRRLLDARLQRGVALVRARPIEVRLRTFYVRSAREQDSIGKLLQCIFCSHMPSVSSKETRPAECCKQTSPSTRIGRFSFDPARQLFAEARVDIVKFEEDLVYAQLFGSSGTGALSAHRVKLGNLGRNRNGAGRRGGHCLHVPLERARSGSAEVLKIHGTRERKTREREGAVIECCGPVGLGVEGEARGADIDCPECPDKGPSRRRDQ